MWKWLLVVSIVIVLAALGLWALGGLPHTLTSWGPGSNLAVATNGEAVTEPLDPTKKPDPANSGPGWTITCQAKNGDSPFRCSLSQMVVVKGSGNPLANVAFLLADGKGEKPQLSILVPLGVYVPGAITVQMDENPARTVQLKSCNRRGCFADATLTSEEVERLRYGKQLKIAFKNQAQKTILLPLPLDRFDRAYARAGDAAALR